MKKIFCYLVMIVLSACTLEENIKKEEGKDYQDVVHPVDMVDYEFEQRLNSFYESEPIKNEELYGLYKGEFPEDERNPTKLRIHWRDARELALAELELQRPIQAGWEEADISVRPILVLDRDGGDFYRYYEYRVVLEMRFLGAIRIPAYRRTENFATAEVHRYSKDEKTYTIHATGWGYRVSKNMILKQDNQFVDSVIDQVKTIQQDNVFYNILYRLYNSTGTDTIFKDISAKQAYDLLYNEFSKHGSAMDGTKGSLSQRDKELIFDGAALRETCTFRSNLTAVKKRLYKLETLTKFVSKSKNSLITTFNEIQAKSFFEALKVLYYNMGVQSADSLLKKSLRDIYWTHLENNTFSGTLDKYLLNHQWNIFEDLSKFDIDPVIEYPNMHHYPKRNIGNIIEGMTFSEYTLIDDSEHALYIKSHIGFEFSNNKRISLLDPIKNAVETEFDISKLRNGKKSNIVPPPPIIEIPEIIIQVMEVILGQEMTDNVNDVAEQMNHIVLDLLGVAGKWFEFEAGSLMPSYDEEGNLIPNHGGRTELVTGTILTLGFNLVAVADDLKRDMHVLSGQFDEVMNDLDNKLALINLEMGDLHSILEGLSNFPFIDEETKKILRTLSEVVSYYAEGGNDIINNLFKRAFKTWVVWYIPFIPIPGWWTVQKPYYDNDGYKRDWRKAYNDHYDPANDVMTSTGGSGSGPGGGNGGNPPTYVNYVAQNKANQLVQKQHYLTNIILNPPSNYAYKLGVPNIFTFDLNIVMQERQLPDLTPKEVPPAPANPQLAFVPDQLKPYSEEWISVNLWLDENKLYEFNNEGNNTAFSHLSQEELGVIVNTYIDDVYDLYSGNSPIYIDKSILQENITNITTNNNNTLDDPSDDKEEIHIESNIIKNPTKEEKDLQHFININQRRLKFNNKYNILLEEYRGV